ncbi:MAG: DsrE family protein [Cytophagales bacterium]|nr:DsrE family protein [Bernardetiaceae bacterium]MDW8210733.1 DsrE family protein [Cytophagales bacterium]
MKMARLYLQSLLLLAIWGASNLEVVAQERGLPIKKHRVVMQFTNADTAAHRALINQVRNLLEGFGEENLELEIVCHNRGMDVLLKDNPYAPKVMELQRKGVKFLACRQTMIQRNIKDEDIIPCPIVPRGLVWIIERQENGFTYVKGGF